MEKQPHQEYRDELADKLKEIRNSDEENPEIAKVNARGYLENEKNNQEYLSAKELHRHDVDKKMVYKEGYKAGQKEGRREGWLQMVHDYSKDIGPVFSGIREFQPELSQKIDTAVNFLEKIKKDLPETEQGEINEILTKLNSVRVIDKYGWFKNARFVQSEIILNTRGVYEAEPYELIKSFSERGSWEDIQEVLNVLVFHYYHPQEYKDTIRKYKKWAPDKDVTGNPIFSKLFVFDDPNTDYKLDFQEKLRKKISEIYVDREGSTDELKKPMLDVGETADDSDFTLWKDEIMQRIAKNAFGGKFYEFVHTMRFAFQSTWAKTILEDDPQKQFDVKLFSKYAETDQNKLSIRDIDVIISFPLPAEYDSRKDSEEPFDSLPYYSTWLGKMEKYNKTSYMKKPKFSIDENNIATVTIEMRT